MSSKVKAPSTTKENVVEPSRCIDFLQQIMAKKGANPENSQKWAELLVESSLLGIDSHGIRMTERYLNHIEGGGVNIHAQSEVVHREKACQVWDAQGQLGHVTAYEAMAETIRQAKNYGISCTAVKNANHIGACGLYSRMAALEDCVGICMTVSRAAMAPWGGKTPLLGNNPLSIAAPLDGGYPFLLDISSSRVAMGHVTKAIDNGVDIPEDWALDNQGNPTTDPQEAFVGSLLPIGQHKGYGLALGIEILTVLLSGGLFSADVLSWISQTEKPSNASFTMMAIDIEKFLDLPVFKQRMRQLVEKMTQSEVRPGYDKIYFPGELESRTFETRSQNGIPIEEADYQMLQRLADQYDIEALFL